MSVEPANPAYRRQRGSGRFATFGHENNMKIIPTHMMIKHAGLSVVLLCLPMIMPMGGVLGGIGYGMTLIGFIINLPGILILKPIAAYLPKYPLLILMVVLTEFIVFIIPKWIIGMVRRKKQAEQSAAPLPSAPQTGPSEGAH